MSDAHALGTPRVPSIIPAVNPLIRRLLGVGLPFGPNVLFTVRGRTSGQPHTFPVAILEVRGHRYVQSPFGEVNWVKNLRVAGEAVLRTGRRSETVEAVEIPPEVGAPILRDAFAPYLRSRVLSIVFRRLFAMRAEATLDDYLVEARKHPMFELRPRARTEPSAVRSGER
jgi:F420H(2)-dependent quinone reductase